jgi:RNA polymerase sigma-70 factor (ECF subfamily)
VRGLVALMEIQASRFGARTGPSGEPVLLLDQNPARLDQLLVRRGLAALQRAEVQAGAIGRPLGSYALHDAAIASIGIGRAKPHCKSHRWFPDRSTEDC